MDTFRTDAVVVIGAGVVGLALARALSARNQAVLVLEAEARVGTGVTARSSEVIHAGLYYPPTSLKAKTCVRGRELLYAYARERGIPHARVGKLVVATSPGQVEDLAQLRANARESGAGDLGWLEAGEARSLEPELRCVAALWSPRSGIIDSHALTRSLTDDVRRAGGDVACRVPVDAIETMPRLAVVTGGVTPCRLECRAVIVAAGLGSRALAATCLSSSFLPSPPRLYAKGNYFTAPGCPPPFRRLIYPLPEPGGLGVHATVDLSGQVRFGPDVEWTAEPDLRPDPGRAVRFEAAVRAYWPRLPEGALRPSYAGIRPKITGPGEPAADFLVLGERNHGIRGLTVLLGIESPGLTASLALAEEVAEEF